MTDKDYLNLLETQRQTLIWSQAQDKRIENLEETVKLLISSVKDLGSIVKLVGLKSSMHTF